MKLKHIFYIAAAITGLGSCSTEIDSPEQMLSENEDAVLINAGTSGMLSTRGEYETDEDGNVSAGLFYLTYPTTDSKAEKLQFNRLYVDFDKAKFYPKYNRRYAYTEGKETGSELTNAMIGSFPNTLFLDNVDPYSDNAENDTLVIFPVENNPYTAGLMTIDKDILWGSEQKQTQNRYDFDLHHRMAGMRVKITVAASENDNLIDQYDLSKAEVYLTNVVLEPYSFNRVNGNVNLAKNPVYSPRFPMVNNLNDDGSEEETGWKSTTTEYPDSEENPGDPVYITYDFILPPQAPSEEHWPELVVRFPNPTPEEADEKPYKEFYGKIPKGMFTNYEGKTNYGLDLSFLPEHILEIRTRISQNPPQLIFMPVKVYNWVKWETYTVIGHQEGIYETNQLYDIIRFYQSNNAKMLERYGEIKTLSNAEVWVFDIFSNLTVELNQIRGAMQRTDRPNGVVFRLNGHKIRITDDEDKVIYTITEDSEFNALIVDGIWPNE